MNKKIKKSKVNKSKVNKSIDSELMDTLVKLAIENRKLKEPIFCGNCGCQVLRR